MNYLHSIQKVSNDCDYIVRRWYYRGFLLGNIFDTYPSFLIQLVAGGGTVKVLSTHEHAQNVHPSLDLQSNLFAPPSVGCLGRRWKQWHHKLRGSRRRHQLVVFFNSKLLLILVLCSSTRVPLTDLWLIAANRQWSISQTKTRPNQWNQIKRLTLPPHSKVQPDPRS